MLDVLIADDSLMMRMMLKRTLKLSGLDLGSVYEAANGVEALEVLAQNDVDVLLLDLNMPVKGGEAVIEELRRDGRLERLTVLVVSTEFNEAKIEEFRSLGIGFLRKPFTPEQLRDFILQAVGDTHDPSGP